MLGCSDSLLRAVIVGLKSFLSREPSSTTTNHYPLVRSCFSRTVVNRQQGKSRTDPSRCRRFAKETGQQLGPQKVRINCYSSQSPKEKAKPVVGERSIGSLLIPRQYTSFDTSGFTADVSPDE